MKDPDCVHFLQQVLPQLHLRWSGFRRVRRQVCRRLRSRIQELDLADFSDYAAYLLAHPDEWSVVDACCRITISRFYRDRQVFEQLSQELPRLTKLALARGDSSLRCWSAGCASGEEAYTLKLMEHFCLSGSDFSLPLQILATDVDAVCRFGRFGKRVRSTAEIAKPQRGRSDEEVVSVIHYDAAVVRNASV